MFIDSFEVVRKVRAPRIIEDDDRSIRGDERVPHRVVHGPHLHVPAAGGVSDVDRVEQNDAAEIVANQLRLDPFESVRPNRSLIDAREVAYPIRGFAAITHSNLPIISIPTISHG